MHSLSEDFGGGQLAEDFGGDFLAEAESVSRPTDSKTNWLTAALFWNGLATDRKQIVRRPSFTFRPAGFRSRFATHPSAQAALDLWARGDNEQSTMLQGKSTSSLEGDHSFALGSWARGSSFRDQMRRKISGHRGSHPHSGGSGHEHKLVAQAEATDACKHRSWWRRLFGGSSRPHVHGDSRQAEAATAAPRFSCANAMGDSMPIALPLALPQALIKTGERENTSSLSRSSSSASPSLPPITVTAGAAHHDSAGPTISYQL